MSRQLQTWLWLTYKFITYPGCPTMYQKRMTILGFDREMYNQIKYIWMFFFLSKSVQQKHFYKNIENLYNKLPINIFELTPRSSISTQFRLPTVCGTKMRKINKRSSCFFSLKLKVQILLSILPKKRLLKNPPFSQQPPFWHKTWKFEKI